jgi:hypothetical protein
MATQAGATRTRSGCSPAVALSPPAAVEGRMDRDDDGIPDWQQDENYADEAPVRGPWRTRARRAGTMAGCALPAALLLAAAGTLARLAAGRRRG